MKKSQIRKKILKKRENNYHKNLNINFNYILKILKNNKINGKVIFMKVLIGLLPRLAAALVTLWSNPESVAVTVITTKGVPKIIWAITIPRCVAANPTFAIKKKIATPEIINGTIIGDINVAMIKPL